MGGPKTIKGTPLHMRCHETSKDLGLFVGLLLGLVATLVGSLGIALANPGPGPSKTYKVTKIVRLTLQGSINPGSRDLYLRAIEAANSQPESMLVVLLDTPGGLVSSLRDMVQATMDSKVPVVIFVYPPGAQAASAGAILTISAHIAAMAPGTNIGAAHPVAIGLPQGQKGEDNGTMAKKAENDIAAMARSIAQEMGRNATWAERAVRMSISSTAKEALRHGVIDLMAKDLEDLEEKVEGRRVRLRGEDVHIHLSNPVYITVTPTLRERVLSLIGDPNIAYVLMMIGIVGLYFELAHPGAIFPGVIGGISLLLALYALQALPVSAVGLLLIVLGAILFVLELFIVSHGLLGTFGLLSLILGSLMLFDVEGGGIGLSLSVLIPTIFTVGAGLFAIAFLAARATFSRPISGASGLIGEQGTVRSVMGRGKYLVFIHGELWTSYSDEGLQPGDVVEVEGLDGLKLKVKKIKNKIA